jgi:putative hemolysin
MKLIIDSMSEAGPIFFLNYIQQLPLASIAGEFIPILSGGVIFVVLIILSGLISGSEIAFFSINPGLLKNLNKSEKTSDRLIMRHLDNPRRLLATILISNNFVNISLVLVAAWLTPFIYDFSNSPLLGFIVQVVAITGILLLFGEILPKIYARQRVDFFIHMMARPISVLTRAFWPLVILLENSTKFMDRIMLKRKNTITMSELSEVVEIAHEQAYDVETEDVKILKGITTFGETEVRDIMKARVDVSSIDYQTSFEELVEFIREWGFSRFPVYEETFDQIKGVLHIKDLLPYLHQSGFKWQSVLREPIFIPENKKINDLLQEFKSKKIHLAIVVDEYGGTSGIVTLEDILEEILGEISDEFDQTESDNNIIKVGDEEWVMDAKTSINDLCKFLDLDLNFFDGVKGESDSVGGIILEITGDFPSIGHKCKYKNYDFEVVLTDKRRIKRVKIKQNQVR